MATAEPCPPPIADRGIEGGPDPPVREIRVSVISSDLAVRESLVLLLEAEGIMARACCTVSAFLAALDLASATQRHCVVIERGQARNAELEGLSDLHAHAGRSLSIVVLTADPARHRPRDAAPGAISYVDPFGLDDVLRAIRQALAAP